MTSRADAYKLYRGQTYSHVGQRRTLLLEALVSMVLRDKIARRLADSQEDLSHFDAELNRIVSSFSSNQREKRANVMAGPDSTAGMNSSTTSKSKLLSSACKTAPLSHKVTPSPSVHKQLSVSCTLIRTRINKEPVVVPSDIKDGSDIEVLDNPPIKVSDKSKGKCSIVKLMQILTYLSFCILHCA